MVMSAVQPMKRQRFVEQLTSSDEPESKRQELLPVQTLDIMPSEILARIFGFEEIPEKAPWDAIKRVGRQLIFTCKGFSQLLKSDVSFMNTFAITLDVPQIHIYALIGNWSNVFNFIRDHDHQPDRCLQACDRFNKSASEYLTKGGSISNLWGCQSYDSSKYCELNSRALAKKDITLQELDKFSTTMSFKKSITESIEKQDEDLENIAMFERTLDVLIQSGGNINFTCTFSSDDNKILVFCLIALGKEKLLTSLLKFAEKQNLINHVLVACTQQGESVFHEAAKKGRSGCVTILMDCAKRNEISIDPLIQRVDSGGNSVLHKIFSWYGKDGTDPLGCLKIFLDYGIDINATNRQGSTLLHEAVRHAQPDHLEAVLEQPRIFLNAQDNDGTTPFHIAVEWNKSDALNALLAQGIDVNIQDESGLPAHFYGRDLKSDDFKKLLEAGVDLKLVAGYGTILHYLAAYGRSDLLKIVIDYNELDLNVRNYKGYTPAHCAASYGKYKSLKFLFECGADMSIKAHDSQEGDGSNGLTVCDVAREAGHLEIVKFLEDSKKNFIQKKYSDLCAWYHGEQD